MRPAAGACEPRRAGLMSSGAFDPFMQESEKTTMAVKKTVQPGRALRKVWEIVKYLLSSSTGSLADYLLFAGLTLYTDVDEMMAFTVARIAGAAVNFLINKLIVFRDSKSDLKTWVTEIVKYAIYWTLMYFCARGLFHFYSVTFSIHNLIAKPMADMTLYGFGYLMQRFVIFRRVTPKKPGTGGEDAAEVEEDTPPCDETSEN